MLPREEPTLKEHHSKFSEVWIENLVCLNAPARIDPQNAPTSFDDEICDFCTIITRLERL